MRLVPVPPRRAPSLPPKRLAVPLRSRQREQQRSGSRRDDTPTRRVKEEPEDVKPVVIPPGFEVPPELQDEVHDGDIPGIS